MPIEWPHDTKHRPDEVDSDSDDETSLSYPSSATSFDEDDHAAMIQEEWEESMHQIEAVLSVIVLPFFGKWWGRRFAFWAFERYKVLGWTRAFFGLRA